MTLRGAQSLSAVETATFISLVLQSSCVLWSGIPAGPRTHPQEKPDGNNNNNSFELRRETVVEVFLPSSRG